MMATITEVAGGELLEEVRKLFLEYAASTGLDLSFQGFDHELATLPGKYARPQGRLLLLIEDGRPGGCVGMRSLEGRRPAASRRASWPGGSISQNSSNPTVERTCEMKRFYIRPEFRGRGLGRVLANRIIDEARQAGYTTMLLDTLPTMTAAIALYERLGFHDTALYTHNPVPGTRFFELVL